MLKASGADAGTDSPPRPARNRRVLGSDRRAQRSPAQSSGSLDGATCIAGESENRRIAARGSRRATSEITP